MKRVLQMWLLALAVLVGVQAEARPAAQGGSPQSHGEMSSRLSRRSSFGRINIQGGKKHFPEGAEVSIERKRPDDVKAKIHKGRKNRVLASYDISIRHGGRKWQPDAGDPVRVDMQLDEPVPVTDASSLGVVHLADDGTVETLPASRYGFTYNAARTAVTAFWFKATGFSVYAIVDEGSGNTPGRRLYGFYTLDNDDVTYVPRYFVTQDGNRSYRQIVKSGEKLTEPEALPSPAGRTFMGWFLYDASKANTEGYDANGYATAPFDFSQPVVFDTLGEEEFALRAVFAHNAHVIFHEQPVENDWPITGVRRGQLTQNASTGKWEASVPIDDMVVTYDDSKEEEHSNATPKMIFRGWSLVPVTPGSLTNVLGEAIHLESSPFVVTLDTISSTTLGPTHLYPVFVNINWITYKSAETGQGATYIPPKYYYMDEGTNSFPVPVRTGYAFNGWWTGTNTGVQVTTPAGALVTGNLPTTLEAAAQDDAWGGYVSGGKLLLAKSVTLFGRWTPAPAKYAVVIWQQKATDAANLDVTNRTYDFVASYTNYAEAATQVDVDQKYTSWSGQASNTVHAADYVGFSYARCDDAKTVEGNGSTVLNVYYDRNVHTLTYSVAVSCRYNNNSYQLNFNGTYNGNPYSTKTVSGYTLGKSNSTYYFQMSGKWYQISSNGNRAWDASSIEFSAVTNITALSGSVIKDAYPIAGYDGKSWLDVKSIEYTERLTALETMPDSDIVFYLYPVDTSNNKGGLINYYLEVREDEEGEKVSWKGKYYKLYKSVAHDFNYLTFNEDFYPITGYISDRTNTDATFTLQNGQYRTAQFSQYSVYSFYYDREGYSITFTDSYDKNVISEKDVKYSDVIVSYVPTSVPSSRPGYSFTGWYADESCSTKVFFEENDAYNSYTNNKILFVTMPAHNLQMFAGWETEWYLIQIDPNGGELASGQSTWFWEPYNGDPIEEYATTTRSFMEAYDGTWFYAKKDRAYYGLSDEWDRAENFMPDRGAYYTQDQSDQAIVDANKRYTGPVQNVYRYAGWYEVKDDGSEELYAFGQPVQHNTYLRLHWKHIGTYRLVYHAGAGRMSNGDENEAETFSLLDTSVYADNSEVLVTRTAEAPEGYYFVGWRIRNSDETLYRPGQTFTFNAGYTTTVPGTSGTGTVRQLVLDAVYEKVNTVSLQFDANGGSVAGDGTSAFSLDYENAPTALTNVSGNVVTVYGMRNNAYGHVGDGTGFSCTVDGVPLEFLGWNTAADGTGTHFDPGALIGLDVDGTLNADGVNTLYAEWGVKVYFDINNTDANEVEWPSNYVWDAEKSMYYQNVVLHGCASDPDVPLTSSNPQDMFYYWGEKRYTGEVEQFDFSQAITNATLTLYAFWSNRIEVAVHAVDATRDARTDKDEWLAQESILMNVDTVKSFETDAAGCVNVPAGYVFAFACVSDSKDNISEDLSITNLYYDIHEKHVCVTYADGTSGPLPDDKEIYFVYYTPSGDLGIGYKLMDLRGNLTDVTVTAAAPKTAPVGTSDATAYDMAGSVAAPRAYASDRHAYFAYAIGDLNSTTSTNLHLITTASKTDNNRPALLVKETWNGYRYSLDGGENWVEYGYDAKLYVIYFDNHPTIVTLNEKTLGTAADMAEQFDYTVVVAQFIVTRTESQVQRQRRYGDTAWYDYGDPTFSNPSTNSLQTISYANVALIDGGIDSTTLMYSFTESTWNNGSNGSYYYEGSTQYRNRTNTRTVTETIQRVTITQTPKNGFMTTNDGVGGDQKYVYTYTVTGAEDEPDQTVTFTNTHTAEPVTLHVALSQSGTVTGRDDLRATEAGLYTLSITNGTDNVVTLGNAAPDGFFTGDASIYRPVGLVYGRTNENGVVEVTAAVTSVAFAPLADSPYYGLYVNGDNTLTLDDGYGLYYVYSEMPKVYYMKETSNGALTAIDPITYMGNAVTNMGFGTTTIAQGNVIDVDVDNGTVIAASGRNNYRVPTLLDGERPEPMNRASFAVGTPGLTNMSAMDGVTTETELQIKVVAGALKWSADGATWNDFSGSPTVYAIYKEVGFDLTINSPSSASDADKAADTFTITITSDNLVDGVEYLISGYSSENVTPANNTITLTVTGGSHVVIQSLPNKAAGYTVAETVPERYNMESLTVNGAPPTSQELTENGNGVVLYMESDKTVEFTIIKSYDVTFVDEDGSTISTGTYPYGTKPSEFMDGVVQPTKERTETTIYPFDDWDPEVGSVGSNTTYTAVYKEIKLPQVTQRVADTNLVVVLENDQALIDTLKTQGIDLLADGYSQEEANAILNTVDANGLRRWENLVTGTASNQFLLSTSTESERSSAMRLAVDFDAAKYADLGYTVLHDLRKQMDGAWVRVAGPATGNNPSFSIELQDAGGNSRNASGLYRVVTLIVPNQDLSITNEIPSTNIIGVLEVNNAVSNTITAVPWKQLASDPAAARDITVSNFVAALNLSVGDAVYTLDAEQRGYQMWNRQSNGIWEPVTTVRTADDGSSLALQAESADVARLPRGNAAWVKRADTTKPYFLVGQYDEAEITVAVPGKTDAGAGLALIAIPTFKPLYLNKPDDYDGTQAYIDWSKYSINSLDQIRVPVNGVQTALTYQNGKWGYYVTTTVWNAKRKKNVISSAFTPYTGIIPAGTGFFYFRMASEGFTFSWK